MRQERRLRRRFGVAGRYVEMHALPRAAGSTEALLRLRSCRSCVFADAADHPACLRHPEIVRLGNV